MTPLPLGDFRNVLMSMTSTEDDMTDIIDAVANLDETSSYANAMQDMLKLLTQNDEFIGTDNTCIFNHTNISKHVGVYNFLEKKILIMFKILQSENITVFTSIHYRQDI